MVLVEVAEGKAWDDAILGLPHSHILQSFAWGEFKSRHGWCPIRMLWQEGATLRAAAQLLLRQIGPWRMAYVPRGPVLDYADDSLLEEVLVGLAERAGKAGAIFIKIDPEWPEGEKAVRALFVKQGWWPAEEVQFRSTLIVDLAPGEEEILAQMKPKARYNARLAERKGVEVVAGGVEDLELFYRMYQETSARDRFVIRSFDYYRDLWADFLNQGLARIFLARYEGEILAGIIVFRYGERAWYMYGASIDKHRNLMPNHALQWAAMRWAKAQGVKSYDLWGAPANPDDPEDRLAGVYRFKAGFGGELARHIGAFDYVVNAPAYWLYTQAIPRVLSLWRCAYYSRNFSTAGPA